MIDIETPDSEDIGYLAVKSKTTNRGLPIKKCHYLVDKYFIVIDKSIVGKLNFSNHDNTELYFEQGLSADNEIILRRYEMRD